MTVMNARAAALFADSSEHADWAWAGDQLYVDLDLGKGNLPPGSRIAVGDAVLEVTAEPHLGCGKFSRRFGVDALKVVNSAIGREMRLRGLNAKVIRPGAVAVGDPVRKLGSRTGRLATGTASAPPRRCCGRSTGIGPVRARQLCRGLTSGVAPRSTIRLHSIIATSFVTRSMVL